MIKENSILRNLLSFYVHSVDWKRKRGNIPHYLLLKDKNSHIYYILCGDGAPGTFAQGKRRLIAKMSQIFEQKSQKCKSPCLGPSFVQYNVINDFIVWKADSDHNFFQKLWSNNLHREFVPSSDPPLTSVKEKSSKNAIIHLQIGIL